MSTTVLLYDAPRPAPNPRRVRVFLAEKGLEVPLAPLSLPRREHKAPEFTAKNSLGQVPALELDDGTIIAESVSICRYFEALHPEPPLFGRTPLEQAQIDMWNRRVELQLMGPVGQVWRHSHPFTAFLGGQIHEQGEANRPLYARALRWLDREIAGRDFIAGSAFTVADITALCVIDFAAFVGLPLPGEHANLAAWHARVSARPSASA